MAKNVLTCWADALSKGDEESMRRAHGFLKELNSMIIDKLDYATSYSLRFVDNIVNERSEFQIEHSVEGVSIGVWGNASEIRPIRKAIMFEEMGIQIDVPKQILSQDSRFVHRVVKIPIDTHSIAAYDTQLQPLLAGEKFVLGDLYYLDILFFPAQPFSLRAKKWTIRDKSPSSLALRKSSYPSSVACKCTFKVPPGIKMTDDVRVAFWSDEKQR